jgi:membrane-associated phospholipid phosphatase
MSKMNIQIPNNILINIPLGILFDIVLVKILKNIIKEDRPIPKGTYGMPSSRSTYLFFLAFYISTFTDDVKTKYIIFALILACVMVKIVYKEHSASQITVGALIGYCTYRLILGLDLLKDKESDIQSI